MCIIIQGIRDRMRRVAALAVGTIIVACSASAWLAPSTANAATADDAQDDLLNVLRSMRLPDHSVGPGFFERDPAVDPIWQDFREDPVDAALKPAVTDLAAKRYDDAVQKLAGVCERYPESGRVWFVLSVAQFSRDEPLLALDAADRCVRVDPRWVQGHWLRGNLLANRDSPAEARAAFDRAVRIAPGTSGVYLQRGRFLVTHLGGDPSAIRDAINDLNRALELGAPPESTRGYLGMAYQHLGQHSTAAEQFRMVLELQPSSIAAMERLVETYDVLGEPGRADDLLASFKNGLNREDGQRWAYLSLVEARHGVRAGAPDSIIEPLYRTAIQGDPEHVFAILEFARWLEQRGRPCDAIPVLSDSLREPPFDPDLASHYAWILADCNTNLQEAMKWAQHALASKPDDPYLGDTVAWIEYRQGKYERALSTISGSLPYARTTPEIAYHAGAIYAKLGKHDEAVRFLESALQAGRSFSGQAEASQLYDSLLQSK